MFRFVDGIQSNATLQNNEIFEKLLFLRPRGLQQVISHISLVLTFQCMLGESCTCTYPS